MKRFFSAALLLISSLAQAADIARTAEPSDLKVRAVSNFWKSIYTPQLTYPIPVSFKVTNKGTDETWEAVIEKAIVSIDPEDLKKVTLRKVETVEKVREESSDMADLIGIGDEELKGKMERAFRNPERQVKRRVFAADAQNSRNDNDPRLLEGSALVIVDEINSEVSVYAYGDVFDTLSLSADE